MLQPTVQHSDDDSSETSPSRSLLHTRVSLKAGVPAGEAHEQEDDHRQQNDCKHNDNLHLAVLQPHATSQRAAGTLKPIRLGS